MADFYYPSIDVIKLSASGERLEIRSETILVENITQSVSLTSLTTDANGTLPEGSYATADPAADGDVIELSHATYPETTRLTLKSTQELAYTTAENNVAAFIIENLFTSTNDSEAADIYAVDTAELGSAPVYIGTAKAGATTLLPFQTGVPKTMRFYAISQDTEFQRNAFDFYYAPFVDLVIPGSGDSMGTIAVDGAGTISPPASSFNYAIVKFTGVLTGHRTVNWPVTNTRQTIIFWNATTGDFNLYVKATPEATGIRIVRDAQAILINDGAIAIDVTAAVSRIPFWCLEFDGTPQSVDFGQLYPQDEDLGDCFYENYGKLLPGADSSKYDWSEGYGAAHAMLRNPYGGNMFRGGIIIDATNATPIVITTKRTHGLSTGNVLAYISGVLGNTAANGTTLTITVLSTTTFSIDGSVGNGSYLGGGVLAGTASFGGSGLISFSADDVPYIGQWYHSATGLCNDKIVHYYDGVPVGEADFVGTRICPFLGGNGHGYLGGSDHNNFLGRLAQYRLIEGSNPHQDAGFGDAGYLAAFVPEVVFGGQQAGGGIISDAGLLVDFYSPEQIVTDKSTGYPRGSAHPGKIRGTGSSVTSNRSSYPGPQYVTDADAPNALGLVAPVQPAGRVYTPAAVPSGALVFDSIERKNSTYTFDGYGGIGSTEGGSLGVLPWIYTNPGATTAKYFGILNEQFVVLGNAGETFARVAIAQTDLDIRVSRKVSDVGGAGISTGMMFRYVDDANYCFVCTSGLAGIPGTRATQYINIGQVVAGVATAWTGNQTACPAAWEVLRLLTKSDGTYQVFCDATSIVSNTNAQHAAGTGAGIAIFGDPANFGNGKQGAGLRMRYRNFTVFTNP